MIAGAGIACGGGQPSEVSPLADLLHIDPDGGQDFYSIYEALDAVVAQQARGDEPWSGGLVMHEGVHQLAVDVELPGEATLELLPGTTLAMGPRVHFMVRGHVEALGNEQQPITFTWLEEGMDWGSFVVQGPQPEQNEFIYCVVEHGSEAQIEGESFRGALSFANVDASVRNCTIRDNSGDDGISVGGRAVLVENSVFVGNKDAIDFDATIGGGVIESTFLDNRNDGIDIGERATLIAEHNWIEGCADKGISIGEGSSPLVEHNIIIDGAIGIAIKDGSDPEIHHNTIVGNQVGISAFEAVMGLGGGAGRVSNTIIWGSTGDDIEFLHGSTTAITYSCIEDSSEGQGNLSPGNGCDDPGFADLGAPDFHLRSRAGRWDEGTSSFVLDSETSPCVDAGDPESPFDAETQANGGRANMGAYGNTASASRSE